MEEELKSNFVSLKNRVWKSYKSRINTAERLKGKNEFIAFLSIYYSAILAAVSILNYVNKSENIDVFSIVGTATFAVLNCVLTLIKTRKSRIQRISNSETVDKLTQEVKKRLLQGGNDEKSKNE